jgi:hypothetical protein
VWGCFVNAGTHLTKLDRARFPCTLAVAAGISLLGILFFSVLLGFGVDLLAVAVQRISEGDSEVGMGRWVD